MSRMDPFDEEEDAGVVVPDEEDLEDEGLEDDDVPAEEDEGM